MVKKETSTKRDREKVKQTKKEEKQKEEQQRESWFQNIQLQLKNPNFRNWISEVLQNRKESYLFLLQQSENSTTKQSSSAVWYGRQRKEEASDRGIFPLRNGTTNYSISSRWRES